MMKTDWSSLEEGSSAADEAIKVETARNGGASGMGALLCMTHWEWLEDCD